MGQNTPMSATYLQVPFRDKDSAKALGARTRYRITDFHPECLVAAMGRSNPWLGALGAATRFWRRRVDVIEVLGEDLALRNGTAPPELLPDAMALLAGQPWRGNIRELRNVLEQAAMRSDSQSIDAEQLRMILREAGVEPAAPAPPTPVAGSAAGQHSLLRPLAVQVAELERQAIAAAMAANGGNKLATARLLGISRATLYGRLENPD
mgnify:CR=1 FL=1